MAEGELILNLTKMYKTTLVIRNALGKLVLVSVFSKNSTIRSNRNIRLIRKSTGQGTISEHSVPNNKYAKSVNENLKKCISKHVCT